MSPGDSVQWRPLLLQHVHTHMEKATEIGRLVAGILTLHMLHCNHTLHIAVNVKGMDITLHNAHYFLCPPVRAIGSQNATSTQLQLSTT